MEELERSAIYTITTMASGGGNSSSIIRDRNTARNGILSRASGRFNLPLTSIRLEGNSSTRRHATSPRDDHQRRFGLVQQAHIRILGASDYSRGSLNSSTSDAS
jgi:hypothetical protein